VGLLSGQLAKAIYAGFKGKLLKAQLRREVIAESGGLDALGDPLATSATLYPCEGFVEGYSAFYRAQAGIPETDSKVNLFASSLAARPTKDDKVEIPLASGQWWQLRKVDTDPATALWVCQAFQCKAPE
jgi:hypothetical protein